MTPVSYNNLATVYVKPNNLGDTRTADRIPSREELHEANLSHVDDVRAIMEQMAAEITWRGTVHDWTKTDYEAMFYKDLSDQLSVKDETRFEDRDWYQMHIKKERHHLNANVPDDVNLFDVLEMIADSVAAGRARNKLGAVYRIDIPDYVLYNAFENTVKLIKDHVERPDDE